MTQQEKLNHVHAVLLGILKELDALCAKHNIQYFLDSGTLLGAVRHKAFIPWDDDADVCMTRAEYEKFVKVAKELPEPYRFVRPQDYGGYFFDFVPRIIHMGEALREETDEDRAMNNMQNRIAVDIFILDNAPDGRFAFKKAVLRQKVIYGYAMAHRYNANKHDHSLGERIKIGLLGFVGKHKSLDSIFKMQRKAALRYYGKDTQYYSMSNTLVNELGNKYPREAYSSFTLLPICGYLFHCPADYDLVLTRLYGDYMTPPPEKDRTPLHITNL